MWSGSVLNMSETDDCNSVRQRTREGILSTSASQSTTTFSWLSTVLLLNILTFLVTEYGKPFSVAGFGNWFRDKCNEAGLRNCSAHGLRKATAAHLAECGATTNEILAITGHQSLTQVTGYTRKANRSKMADEAMAKFKW